MITLTRRRARDLRGVFRRHALGLPPLGAIPPLVLRTDGSQLRARYRYGGLAVEHLGDGGGPTPGLVVLPLDALADVEGRDDSAVTARALAPGRTAVCWTDRGIPRTREYEVAPFDSLDPFPESPVDWADAAPSLLDALADAAATSARDSTRYALDAVQIKPAPGGHEVAATDGRQLLVQGGFRLPWEDTLLIPASPVFASPVLPRDRPRAVGRSVTHVALRVGPWTLLLAPLIGRRFPDVARALPDPAAVTTRLRVDPRDAAFLLPALDRLPGADAANAPVTLDLNGRVAVRARAGDGGPAAEVVLARSSYDGPPVRLHTGRAYLALALRLGFTEFELTDPSSPAVGRAGRRVYAWQPLSADAAEAPADDVVAVPSDTDTPRRAAAPRGGPEERPVSEPTDRAAPAAPEPATPGEPSAGLAALIREAEGLHELLGDARGRAARLVAALRRHRKRDRLLNATLASIRGLELTDVAG